MKKTVFIRTLFLLLAATFLTFTVLESCSSRRPNSTVRKLNKM